MTWHSLTSQGMLGFVLIALNWVKDKGGRLIVCVGKLGFSGFGVNLGEKGEKVRVSLKSNK